MSSLFSRLLQPSRYQLMHFLRQAYPYGGPKGTTLPKDFQGEFYINLVDYKGGRITPAFVKVVKSESTGGKRPHRVTVECPECKTWVSFGRFGQHFKIHSRAQELAKMHYDQGVREKTCLHCGIYDSPSKPVVDAVCDSCLKNN